jgi:hypothetical protein
MAPCFMFNNIGAQLTCTVHSPQTFFWVWYATSVVRHRPAGHGYAFSNACLSLFTATPAASPSHVHIFFSSLFKIREWCCFSHVPALTYNFLLISGNNSDGFWIAGTFSLFAETQCNKRKKNSTLTDYDGCLFLFIPTPCTISFTNINDYNTTPTHMIRAP